MQIPTLAYPIVDRLYLNVTDSCTLRCTFCPGHSGAPQVRDHNLTLSAYPHRWISFMSSGNPAGYREVVFCGFGVVGWS